MSPWLLFRKTVPGCRSALSRRLPLSLIVLRSKNSRDSVINADYQLSTLVWLGVRPLLGSDLCFSLTPPPHICLAAPWALLIGYVYSLSTCQHSRLSPHYRSSVSDRHTDHIIYDRCFCSPVLSWLKAAQSRRLSRRGVSMLQGLRSA
jgi:hypothetical protein